MFEYSIDENNAITISSSESKTRWFQPNYPNGESFESREAAELWADLQTAHMNKDNTKEFLPGISREIPKIKKEYSEDS